MVYKPPLLPHPVATNLKLFSLENWSVFHKWYPFLGQKPLISIPYRSLHCFIKPLPFRLASPQTSLGVRLSRIHFSPTDRGPWGRNECVTNEPQRTSAGRLYWKLIEDTWNCSRKLRHVSFISFQYNAKYLKDSRRPRHRGAPVGIISRTLDVDWNPSWSRYLLTLVFCSKFS